jgi:hypothetical protein
MFASIYCDIQKYNCKDWSKYFAMDLRFEKMYATLQIIKLYLHIHTNYTLQENHLET